MNESSEDGDEDKMARDHMFQPRTWTTNLLAEGKRIHGKMRELQYLTFMLAMKINVPSVSVILPTWSQSVV